MFLIKKSKIEKKLPSDLGVDWSKKISILLALFLIFFIGINCKYLEVPVEKNVVL